MIRCECGHATGMQCDRELDAQEAVVLDWVPNHVRVARKERGESPWGDGILLRTSPDCAHMILSILERLG